MLRSLVFCCLLFACAANADELKSSQRHVSVKGTSISRAQPDMVVWNVTIRRTNRELAKAQAACDETVHEVLGLRGEFKIKPEDIQTGYLSIQKVFDRDQFGNSTSFKHYEVVRSITLRQRDTERFDAILTRLIATSDVEVSYQLESSKYHKLRAETRLNAVKAAREKAQAMTELLDATLGRVLSIEEPTENYGSPFSATSNSIRVAPRQAEADEAPGTFAPGAIEIRVSIEVTFAIE